MRKIDINSWERKSHYEWFSRFSDPSLGFDVKLDVTALLSYCKEKSISSFTALMYIVGECINSNRACRLRILNNEVFEIKKANIAYTIMTNDNCFVNCRATLSEGFSTFLQECLFNFEKYYNKNYIQQQYNNTDIVDDIYCSCNPWLNFESVKQPIPDFSSESKSIPRVCWGKYYTEDERTYTTLNIMVNHALVDGKDLSQVFNVIQDKINNIEKFLSY